MLAPTLAREVLAVLALQHRAAAPVPTHLPVRQQALLAHRQAQVCGACCAMVLCWRSWRTTMAAMHPRCLLQQLRLESFLMSATAAAAPRVDPLAALPLAPLQHRLQLPTR